MFAERRRLADAPLPPVVVGVVGEAVAALVERGEPASGMDEPSSYVYEDGRPLPAHDMTDHFRCGMLQIARAAGKADRTWLERTVRDLVGDG